jgi:Tol biopolymer transport system component
LDKQFLTEGRFPAWSPDGKKIVYVLSDIQIIDVTSKQTVRLTSGITCFFPTWSPDGKKIAYEVAPPGDAAGIWIMNADGSEKRQVVRSGRARMPDWSPDGKKLVFILSVDGEGPGEVATVSLQDFSIVHLTSDVFQDYYPAWSPDGQKIAWCAHRGSKPSAASIGVWVMNADGTQQRQLARWGYKPSWSPDGSQIVYDQDNEDRSQSYLLTITLYMMNADGTNRRHLTLP